MLNGQEIENRHLHTIFHWYYETQVGLIFWVSETSSTKKVYIYQGPAIPFKLY